MDRLGDLLARLAGLQIRVRDAVAARRSVDPSPDDPFRGLYLSDEAIDALLAAPRLPYPGPDLATDSDSTPEPNVASGEQTRLVPATTGLTALDTELLLVAVAPDVDSRFEQFYGYLNDDVTRRRATVGLALRLCGLPEPVAAGRARLDADAPLLTAGLIVVEEPQRPFLSRTLRVPDRVVGYLLGDDRPDPVLRTLLDDVVPEPEMPDVDLLARALHNGARLAYLRERAGGSGASLGVSALHRTGRTALTVDAVRLADAPELAGPLLREALLSGSGVVLGPLDGVDIGPALEAFGRVDVPLVLYGTAGWDPRWSRRPALRLDARTVPPAVRAAVWRTALHGRLAPGVDPAEVTAHFGLGPPQIRRAADAAPNTPAVPVMCQPAS